MKDERPTDKTGLRLDGPSEPIYSDQLVLIGQRELVGWRKGGLECRLVPRDLANDLIVRHHYSGKVYGLSYIHFGAFWNGDLIGIAQYGYAMNPASQGSIVAGTGSKEYLELNRLWVDDPMPRNTASAFLALTIKAIKGTTSVAWIQSFADERCRLFGGLYQACSFDYLGEHSATFWDIDGKWFHNINMTIIDEKKMCDENRYAQANKHKATRHELRQFRYIKFLRKGFRERLQYKILPYPKPNEGKLL